MSVSEINNVATVSSDSLSVSATPTTAPPVTSSTAKLAPAPEPLVSAWGAKGELPQPKTLSSQKEHWPTTEAVLSGSSSQVQNHQASKPAAPSAPRVKSTGKEKWIPLEANIVFQTPASSKKRSNNKKRQQNKNTNKTNNSNKSSNNNNNNNRKKTGGSGSNEKTHYKSTNADKTATASSSSTPQQQESKAKDDVNKGIENLNLYSDSNDSIGSPSKIEQELASDTNQEQLSNDENSRSNSQIAQQQQQQHSSNQNQQHYNNKKKYLHRNSEPFEHQEHQQQPQQQQFQQSPINQQQYGYHKGNRRYHPNNKPHYNNYRHSVSGAANYANIPFFFNPNAGSSAATGVYPYATYPYFPALTPPVNMGASYNPRGSNHSSAGKGDHLPSHTPVVGAAAIPGSTSPAAFMGSPVPYPYDDPLALVVNQLNYYFSLENLFKDFYLRKQMNSNGFVPLETLIEFKRLNVLTGGDIQVLKDAVQLTPQLEVISGKVRVRSNWSNWILPFDQRDDSGKDETPEQIDDEAEGTKEEAESSN